MATAINLSISCDFSVQTETLTIVDEPKGVVSYILKDGDLLEGTNDLDISITYPIGKYTSETKILCFVT